MVTPERGLPCKGVCLAVLSDQCWETWIPAMIMSLSWLQIHNTGSQFPFLSGGNSVVSVAAVSQEGWLRLRGTRSSCQPCFHPLLSARQGPGPHSDSRTCHKLGSDMGQCYCLKRQYFPKIFPTEQHFCGLLLSIQH